MHILLSSTTLFIVLGLLGAVLLVTVVQMGWLNPKDKRMEELAEKQREPAPVEHVPSGKRTHRDSQVDKELKKQKDRLRLVQAGLYSNSAAVVFGVVRICLLVGFIGAALISAVFGLIPYTYALVGSGLLGIFATIAPSFWLDRAKTKRQTAIRRALPDALDILGVCMAGGLSLPAAIGRVSRELATAHPLLALELAIVDREMQLGRSTGEALREFAYRFDLEELRNLATVIMQAEKFGSSLVKTLDVFAETLRTKRQQRAEEMAQKAAIKILFPTLFCIFPAMFVVILGPAAIKIYDFMANNEAIKDAGIF